MNLRLLYVLCLAASVSGCGDGRPSMVPVSGSITLNGEPLAGATIGFQPQDIEGFSRASNATSDGQGKFTVGTFGKDDGMPEGKYLVTVAKTEAMGELPDGYNEEEPEANERPVKMQSVVPLMYSNPEESGLTVEVTSDGMQPDTIALEGDPEVIGGRRRNEP